MLGPGLLVLATISGCPLVAYCVYCGLGLGRLSSPRAAAGPGLMVRPGTGDPRPPIAMPGPGLLLRELGGYVFIGMLS